MKLLSGFVAFIMACAPLFAQEKFSMSTDKKVYQCRDKIHITISAVNTDSTSKTLVFPTACQVSYRIDSFDLSQYLYYTQGFTYRVISPHDTFTWSASYLPPYPLTGDTLAVGYHMVVGEVIGYWTSGITLIQVSPATAVREIERNSRDYLLEDNYPNPFNPSTRIRYTIPKTTMVQLKIVDALGRDVATIVSGEHSAGVYEAVWNASNAPSGIYFYRLQAGEFVETKNMILLK